MPYTPLYPQRMQAWLMAGAFMATSSLLGPWAMAQNGTTINPQPVQAQPQSAVPDVSPSQENRHWPKRFALEQGELTVYQPQLTDFNDNLMKGRAAVSLLGADAEEPIFGAIWLESRVLTDRDARTVQIIEVNVTRMRFPDIEQEPQLSDLSRAMTQAFRDNPMVFSLDQLLTMLETVKLDAQTVRTLETTPPEILFVNEPAVLLQYDGEPRLTQTTDSRLMQVVNTPFFVVLDNTTNRYYLKGAGRWYIAREATGQFLPMHGVPAHVSELAVSKSYVDPEEDMAVTASRDSNAQAPRIITATAPTELVWTDGQEEMSPIPGTNLLYVANTDSDVFLDISNQNVYLLLSGRWYTSTQRSGPWTYVDPTRLPADFQRIPPNSPKGPVLAHVAGTQMARDAVADNYVPQTAAIDRRDYQQPVVEYDGTPKFEPITNLNVTYAINTPNAVLYTQGRYYTCYNAVWYVSSVPNGPWELCTVVPSDFYLIPPSYPVYSVRYVRVYDVTPSVVYVGYLPGYVGSYIHHGVVVYGTGYHYRPWYGQVYYPRPYTYGFSVRYDPYRSYWGFGIGVNVSRHVSLWFGTSYYNRPSHALWFGYGGYRPVYHHAHYRRSSTSAYRDGYREGYRDARDRDDRRPPRRGDYNLYERRRDVRQITSTHRPNVTVNNITVNNNGRRGDGTIISRTGRDRDEDRSRRGDITPGRRGEMSNRDQDRDRNRDDDRAPRPDRGERPDRTDRTDRPDRTDRADGVTRPDRTDRPDRISTQRPTPSREGRQDRNDVFTDPQGNVYRRGSEGWERRERNQWTPTRQSPGDASSSPRPSRDAVTPTNPTRPTDSPRDNRTDRPGRVAPQNPTQRQTGTIDRSSPYVPPSRPTAVTPSQRTGSSDRSATPAAGSRSSRSSATPSSGMSGSPGVRSTPSSSRQPGSVESLNRDYRARILGQQREQIYNSPTQRGSAGPAGASSSRSSPATRSETNTRSSSESGNRGSRASQQRQSNTSSSERSSSSGRGESSRGSRGSSSGRDGGGSRR